MLYISCQFTDFEKTRGINYLRVRNRSVVPAYKQWNNFRDRLCPVKVDNLETLDGYLRKLLKSFQEQLIIALNNGQSW